MVLGSNDFENLSWQNVEDSRYSVFVGGNSGIGEVESIVESVSPNSTFDHVRISFGKTPPLSGEFVLYSSAGQLALRFKSGGATEIDLDISA